MRKKLRDMVLNKDPEEIEAGRDLVRPGDVPALVDFYWTLPGWSEKLALVDLIQDQDHPSMEDVLLDVLMAPGDGQDQVDFPKMFAVGFLSEEHDRFASYINDRAALGRAVDEVLELYGRPGRAVPEAGPVQLVSPLPAEPDEALWVAVNEGRAEDAARLLQEGGSVSMRRDGDPLLLRALMQGHEEIALLLLDAGADPNARRDTAGQPALYWAAINGMTRAVEALLDRGADVDASDEWGATPLIEAATHGHVEMVRRLLLAGADPLTRISDGRTALNLAVRGGKTETLSLLLDAGADLQSKQPTFTPLAFACLEGTTEQVELLLERGADPDVTIDHGGYHGATPLMLAAASGKVKMVEALLRAGANPSFKDRKGRTADDYSHGKRKERIRELLESASRR